jgi:hypothetical protein
LLHEIAGLLRVVLHVPGLVPEQVQAFSQSLADMLNPLPLTPADSHNWPTFPAPWSTS